MKLSIVLFGLWLFSIPYGYGQKDLSRTYVSENMAQLIVDASGVHELTISAVPSDKISVVVHVEGETSNEIVIHEQVSGNQLSLGFGLWPLAKKYDDKLAAHKVVSVVVSMLIPENLFVSIASKTSSVVATGMFDLLYVTLEDEACVLKNYSGNATVKTNRGAIKIAVGNHNSKAKAKTDYGTIIDMLNGDGTFTIYAESKHGNITLSQTQ